MGEVTENGWGEFEATIRIVWRDPCERSTMLTHGIKLYPPGLTSVIPASNHNTKEPVIHEKYEEVVFTDPTEFYFNELNRWPVVSKIKSNEDTVQENFLSYTDEDDFQALIAAQKFLDEELEKVKDRIMQTDVEKNEVETALKAATHTSRYPLTGSTTNNLSKISTTASNSTKISKLKSNENE